MWFFFFFKQKTAYEMRISDWSSDVCSSDLIGRALVAQRDREMGRVGEHDMRARHRLFDRAFRHLALARAHRALGLGRAFAFLVLVLDLLLAHLDLAEQADDLDRDRKSVV